MNELYTVIETIINEGSSQALNDLITKLNENPGDQSKEYGCGQNTFYALKRFVSASLARDPKIKQNVLKALQQLGSQVPNVAQISKPAFHEFFISATDLSDCTSKQDKTAYIQGKINVVKALSKVFIGSDKISAHFTQLIDNNDLMQEELVELIYELVGAKIKGLKLNLTKGTNAHLLFEILSKKSISKDTINSILSIAIEEYPKESITVKHLGLNLQHSLPSPQQFFTSQYARFTNNSDEQTEDGDLKKLYYLLQIQKYFLQSVTIGKQNIGKFLSTEMVVVWLEQLRVKNKHMRKVAGEITIKLEQDAQFSFEVLKMLHEKKIYLDNISQNHPLAILYSNVDTVKFWTYLVDLVKKSDQQNKDKIIEEQEEEEHQAKKEEYLSELEYLTRERVSDLTPEQIGETLTMLIRAYQQSKRSQKLLNLVWSLFHSLLSVNEQKKKSKKKIVLNLRGSLILSKIALNTLQLETEIIETLTKVIKFLRLKVKAYKEHPTADKLMVAFLNFVTGLVVYCIVYPEEVDVCGQVEFVFKDLEVLVAKERGQTAIVQSADIVGKKKGKKPQASTQEPEDLKKPVHVLIDVFISLLTKAPIFLRSSVNLVFEKLVPFIETSDLDTLLDVIQKPDQQYIEQI